MAAANSVVDLGSFRSIRAARAAADEWLEHADRTINGEPGCTCTVVGHGTKHLASLLDPECPTHQNRDAKPLRRHLLPARAPQ